MRGVGDGVEARPFVEGEGVAGTAIAVETVVPGVKACGGSLRPLGNSSG